MPDKTLYDPSNSYIKQVFQSGSMTRAAEILGVTQPALSMRIAQLEKKIGFPIFNRKTNPLTLTEAGKIYIEYLNKLSINEAEMLHRLTDLKESFMQSITIGSPNVYIASIIAPKVNTVLKQYPDLSVRVESASLPELIELSKSAEIDFFISTTEFSNSDFEIVPLKKESTCICIPDGLCRIDQDNEAYTEGALFPELKDLSMLSELPFVFLHNDQPLQTALRNVLEKNHVNVHPVITVDQVTSAISLALAGVGCCLATSESVDSLNSSPDFHIYDFSTYIPQRTIYAAYPKDRYISAACIEIIKILKEDYENESNCS